MDIELCDALFSLREVEYQADYAYWNLVAMGEYLEVTEEYYDTVVSLERVVSKRYDEGYIPKTDLLMMQSRLSEAQYSKISCEQSYAIALQNFNTLRGEADINIEVIPTTTYDTHSPLPLRLPLEEVLNQRSDYASSILSEEYATEGIALARAAYNPSLSIGVQGVWQPYAPNITGETSLSGVAFVNLSIPIFNFGARRKATDIAHRSYNQTLLTTESLTLTIKAEEAEAWSTLQSQYAQLSYTTESLSIASESLEISTYSYSEGLTTILDVMAAQVSWLQLYSNAIASHIAYNVALSTYRRVTGAED